MRRKLLKAGAAALLLCMGVAGSAFFCQAEIRAEETAEPVFSRGSGYYEEEFDLTLSAPKGSTIYYTTDGSIPLSKEDEMAKATPTPLPTATPKPVEFDLSANNTDYVYDVEMNEKENGMQLAFEWRYRSMCFRVPQGETDWTKYKTLTIEFSVDAAANGRNVGLQACPVYSWAPDSYGTNGEFRCFEARTTAEEGAEHEVWEISLNGRDVSNVGWIMLGTTTNEARLVPPDTITVHSIRLEKEAVSGPADEKKDTQIYKEAIRVQDRTGEPNVLATKNNTALMYNSAYATLYAPKDSEVAKATVIRALAVDASGKRSNVVTKTYFVGKNMRENYKKVAVMSIVTDPDNLLHSDTGIYRKENYENSGKEWERPAFVEYFEEDGSSPFATEMGIRLHGGWSRHYGQKSFNLYFRDTVYGGLKNLKDYALIPSATDADGNVIQKYKSFMLRNGGNDTEYTKLQDVWIQGLVRDRAFATQASRPCVLFLNGEYWGPYNLTEKYSDNSIEEEFGVAKENVVAIKDNELDEGQESDMQFYRELQALAELDMKNDENYKKFCNLVDVQSYLDYYAMEVYIGNHDWPQKNTMFWRTRENDGTRYGDTKWRLMLFDTEYSMNLYGQTTGTYPLLWLLEQDELFRSVFQNEEFRGQFINTMCDLINVNFKADDAIASLEQYEAVYKPLMADYFVRYGLDKKEFDNNVSRMKSFIKKRPISIRTDLKAHAGAGGSTLLTIKGLEGSTVQINTTKAALENGIWGGTYFSAYPVTLTAPEVEGYEFTGWKVTNAEKISEQGRTVQLKLSKQPVAEASYREVKKNPETPGNTVKKPGKVTKVRLVSKKKKALRITWKKVKNAAGYQIAIARDAKFKKQVKKTASVEASKTIKGLISKKKYYVRVRAYNKSGSKKQYGAYSAVKSKEVR